MPRCSSTTCFNRGLTADKGAHAREQLLEAEGLGQIVVGADVEFP